MIGFIKCRLGMHDFDTERVQDDTMYVRKKCTRCGEGRYEPR